MEREVDLRDNRTVCDEGCAGEGEARGASIIGKVVQLSTVF